MLFLTVMGLHGSRKTVNALLFVFVNLEALLFLLGCASWLVSVYGRILTLATIGWIAVH